MTRKPSNYFFLCLLFPCFLSAQRVNYSSYINARSPNSFQVIGKSGDYYWIEKEQIRKSFKRQESAYILASQSFAAFDNRLNFVKEIPALKIPGTIKEYLVAGNSFFDQLVLSVSGETTNIYINRYETNAAEQTRSRLIDSFPFSAPGTAFLLARSEDLSKVILVGFETSHSPVPRIHTILFNDDWKVLYHTILEHPYFTQPCIQDDDVSFPAESFDDLPIKLANNGEWLMASTSRTNRNYLLFHIYNNGQRFYYQEIPLSPYYSMEDIAMSIDNVHQGMSVGFLSRYRNTSLKSVEVSHYSMTQTRFDFDSSYRFNSLTGRLQKQNLSNESFISIPGQGYMLFKEYGRPEEPGDSRPPDIDPWDPVFMMAGFSEKEGKPTQTNNNEYAHRNGLQGVRSVFDRGNLTMFYFPVNKKDSCWSGIINTEQTTELNSPALSYLVFPLKDKLYIIYNTRIRASDEFSTTTSLKVNGQPTGDALIFWKMNRVMDFQKYRRISSDEVAVPYRNNQQTGFAIIRLGE